MSTVIGIVLFSALFDLLDAFPYAHTSLWAALRWGIVFRAPSYVLFGTAPLLFALTIMELREVQKPWPYIVVWVLAGVFIGRHNWTAAMVSGAIAACFYWWVAGRTAGNWISDWREQLRQPGAGTCLAYALLAYCAVQAASYGYYGAKLLWVSYVSEPGLGTPPVAFRQMSASRKVALMDFPDVKSCLTRDANETVPDYLEQLDWNRINNRSEAEVCTFRLLASYADIAHATKWFEAQGFEVLKLVHSEHPNVDLDGIQQLNGSYSIRKNGPKYPTNGVVRRLLGSFPYRMTSTSMWSKDGTQLLRVDVSLDIL